MTGSTKSDHSIRRTRRRGGLAPLVLCATAPCILPSADAAAQVPRTATLLVDFDTSPAHPSPSNPLLTTSANGDAWFSALAAPFDVELWRSDGTPRGTRPLDASALGRSASFRSEAVVLANGTLIVSASGSTAGAEIWAQPAGQPGLSLLADIVPGPNGSEPFGLTLWRGNCWFLANETELWRTDGTAAGTRLVEDLTGLFRFRPRDVSVLASAPGLWLTAYGSGNELLLKTAPQTPARLLTDAGSPIAATQLLGMIGSRLVFVRSESNAGHEPAVHDPGTGATISLGDLAPGVVSSSPIPLATEPTRIWFSATDPSHGRELWITDGTPAGTRLVSDIRPGPEPGVDSQAPARLTAGGRLVLAATHPATGVEPFVSDGTGGGTRILVDIQPGPTSSEPANFASHSGRVWFQATNDSFGRELWSTSGTSASTRLEFDLRPGPESGVGRPMASTTAGLLFAGDDGASGLEPWLFDAATRTGTLLVNVAPDLVNTGTGFGQPIRHDDFAWFTVVTAGGIRRPFISRGALNSTLAVSGFGAGDRDLANALGVLPDRGVVFAYRATDGSSGVHLVDGLGRGSTLLARPSGTGPNRGHSNGGLLSGDRIWFVWNDGFSTSDLWVTDGTPAGTLRAPGFLASDRFLPRFAHAGLLYGQGYDPMHSYEPWVSDGTPAGTFRLADVAPGDEHCNPSGFAALGFGVFFVAGSRASGAEPWFSDGTPAGTRPITELYPGPPEGRISHPVSLGAVVLFAAQRPGQGNWELWSTDGTAAGTRVLVNFTTGGPAPSDMEIARIGDRTVVAGDVGTPQSAVWETDGTPQGTRLLFDTALLGATIMGSVTPVGDDGDFAFAAEDFRYGHELWISDGTLTGTRILADSNPGHRDGTPLDLFPLGDGLLFEADDGRTGRELHRIPLSDFGAAIAAPIGRGCGAHIDADAAPRIGQTFALEIQATVGGPAGLVFGTTPAFGSPRLDCEIQVVGPVALGNFATDAQGAARLPVLVPNDPTLVGTHLYLQSVHLRSGGPLFGALELTQGLELLVGD